MKNTINKQELKELEACTEGYKTFIESHGDKTVSFLDAFKSNGWDDIWWLIGEVYEQLSNQQIKELRLLACDYAERVLPIFEKEYPNDKRPRIAIETSCKFACGESTKQELDDAWDAAWAAWDASAARAAWDAARAAWAARAARDAARAAAMAAWAAEKQWQEEKLVELLTKWEK